MPFRARNLFYLRISTTDVLPLYLYLDERHIDWMSDGVLQHVLADLRPLIIPKMKAESHMTEGSGKRGTVDVHRGDFYQFAYFFRGAESHSVILKTRNFTIAPIPPKGQMLPPPPPDVPQSRGGKRKKAKGSSGQKKPKGKARAKTRDIDEEGLRDFESEDEDIDDDYAEYIPRARSRRSSRKPARKDRDHIDVDDDVAPDDTEDVEMAQPTQEGIVKEEAEDALLATPTPETLAAQESITTTSSRTIRRVVINIDEDEEKKPKPVLQLKYKGFSISDRCLCVVVEPWPPIRSASRAPSVAPLQSTGLRRPSIAPPDFVPSTGLRERTPLFLPDDERQETPAPFNQRILLPVPGFNDPPQTIDLDENDESDMMAFTQVLNSAGGLRGTEADDDDMDGAVLFGDADETREL